MLAADAAADARTAAGGMVLPTPHPAATEMQSEAVAGVAREPHADQGGGRPLGHRAGQAGKGAGTARQPPRWRARSLRRRSAAPIKLVPGGAPPPPAAKGSNPAAVPPPPLPTYTVPPSAPRRAPTSRTSPVPSSKRLMAADAAEVRSPPRPVTTAAARQRGVPLAASSESGAQRGWPRGAQQPRIRRARGLTTSGRARLRHLSRPPVITPR